MPNYQSHESHWIAHFALCCALAVLGCGSGTDAGPEVVIYTSLDQIYSQPILERFEQVSGVRTRIVYDTEATKTTGLVNRLIAERKTPRADVFWNSEIIRTIVLKRQGVLAPYRSPSAQDIPDTFKDPENYWTGFAARVRVIGVNTDLLPSDQWPSRFDDLLEPRFRGNFAMAYPLFGTTATHVAALFSVRGPDRAKAWLRGLQRNDARIVDGNSTARDLVVGGTVAVAITDSDDVAAALSRSQPIAMIFPDLDGEGTLLIPNTVALVANGPHPDQGRALIDYLLSPEVERALAEAPGAQIPLREDIPWPKALPGRETLRPMQVDFEDVASQLAAVTRFSKELFVR